MIEEKEKKNEQIEVKKEEKLENKKKEQEDEIQKGEDFEITKEVIIEQLEELRRRLIVPIVSFVLIFLISIPFAKKIMDIFLGQFKEIIPEFIFTKPFESFWAHIKISAYISALISVPLLIWQIWLFISPALYPKERKIARFIIISSSLLFIAGSSFCFLLSYLLH
jgi:sec-independent protein translocase protein TatC